MKVNIHIHDLYRFAGKDLVNVREEQKIQISLWVNEMIKTFVESEDNFVLNELKHIYVTNEYVKELYAFQSEKGLEIGHTKNEVSEGQAMVLSYKNNLGKEETAIFFRAEFIFGLYLAEELEEEHKENIIMLFNIFFHELCHINDDYHTKELFSHNKINELPVIPRNLYPISIGMWKEYYAYRKSSERYPYGDLMYSHLEETAEWAYKEVVKLQEKYKKDDNMNEFMPNFTTIMNYLLRVMVSVIGNVQGYISNENKRDKHFELALTFFSDQKLKCVFNRLTKEFDMLFFEYPDWKDLSRIEVLNDIVLDLFNVFGVFPTEVENDQMYVGLRLYK
ncbi:hypothetical protein bcgnr5372_48520 [Bacillus luti]